MPEIGSGAPLVRFTIGPNLSIIFGEYLQLLGFVMGRGPVQELGTHGVNLVPPPKPGPPPHPGYQATVTPPGTSSRLKLPVRTLTEPPGLTPPQPRTPSQGQGGNIGTPSPQRPSSGQSAQAGPSGSQVQQANQPKPAARHPQGPTPPPQLQTPPPATTPARPSSGVVPTTTATTPSS